MDCSLGPLRGDSIAFRAHEYSSNKQHILYVIRVEWGAGSPWSVKKRYSDFEQLHRQLNDVYGKQQVPELPRKKKIPIGGMATGFVDRRMVKLQMYLRNIIDQSGIWFKMNSDTQAAASQGPISATLGINDIIFEFLEFASNAIMSKPQTVIEGEGVTVVSPSDLTKPNPQIKVLPMMSGVELAALQEKLSDVPLFDDDDKPDILKAEMSELRRNGMTTYINILQAKTLVKEAFLSNNRLDIALHLVPLIQDPHNYPQLVELIDFDAQVDEVTGAFSEHIKRRHRESLNATLADLQSPPVPRKRGITVTPIDE
eukprot:TRINITY_DN18930_c0_g1_i1.p1 TRINITY_DN18930_c0_g1~~TRINITY_DN18930_c0_g1_i1.p1  ORF type:complete len:313 (+),score=54.94 TRINITY_DN18930_c0_g1_i1:70-1008(+)